MVKKAKRLILYFTARQVRNLLNFLYDNGAGIKPSGEEDTEMLRIIRSLQEKLEQNTGNWWS